MTKTTKIILLTTAALLATGGMLYAFRKKKVVKKIGAIIWPEGLDSSYATTDDGTTSIKPGSSGRYVEQLQALLNDIHKATTYINKECSMKWGLIASIPTMSNGNILNENGVFDDNTAKAAQFYLNRTEIELEDLTMFKDKMAKQKQGDKCVYPLSIQL